MRASGARTRPRRRARPDCWGPPARRPFRSPPPLTSWRPARRSFSARSSAWPSALSRLAFDRRSVPELPDVEVYLLHLRRRVAGEVLERVRVASPFLVRSFDPPLKDASGRRVVSLRRVGKRLVFDLDGDVHLVLHLMVAGRLRWRPPGAPVPAKIGLAAFDFVAGTLVLTEASTKKRASL